MSDYFAAVAPEIQSESGTIEKFVGDSIMAVFGVPTVHEDATCRAVRAAWRMLQRLRSWNEGRDPTQRLEIRIGVSTGEALASGASGSDLPRHGGRRQRRRTTQQTAEPGTIVVANRAGRAVRAHFQLRAIEQPLALKGKSEGVAAWLVDVPREAGETRGMPGVATPARRPRARARIPPNHLRSRPLGGPPGARHGGRRRRSRQEPARARVPLAH